MAGLTCSNINGYYGTAWPARYSPYRVSQVANSSNTILLTESTWGGWTGTAYNKVSFALVDIPIVCGSPPNYNGWTYNLCLRHNNNKGLNILWVDGHATNYVPPNPANVYSGIFTAADSWPIQGGANNYWDIH